MCVTVSHLSYASRLLSAWLVTTFTVERFIGVFYPLRRSLIISVSHARRVILAETLACVALAGFAPFTIGIVPARRPGASRLTDCDVYPEMLLRTSPERLTGKSVPEMTYFVSN